MGLRDLRLEEILRYQRPVARLVELGLVLLMAGLVAHLAWLVLDPAGSVVRHQVDSRFPAMTGGGESARALAVDRTLLMQINPFSGAADEVIPDAPETTLNLALSGLLMSSNGDGGSAIIRTANGANVSFSPGEAVLPGVTLERILSDRVILSRNGAQEALMLGGRGEGLSVIGGGAQVAEFEDENSRSSVTPPAPVQARISDPLALASAIALAPVDRDGKTVGLRVSLIGSPDIMRRAGLAPGDIIKAIDGTSPGAEAMSLLLANLRRGDTVAVDIERNGSGQSIILVVGD